MIHLETLLEAFKTIKEFNSTDLETVDLLFNGEKVEIPTKLIKRWKFIGFEHIKMFEDFDGDIYQHFAILEEEFL